jgi:uncharacterized protein (TIGR03382 family)
MTLLVLALVGVAGAIPLSAPFSDAHYGYYYPTAYYDHGGVDWACGSIRYSGHRGNDFGAGSWSGMAAGRNIAAAADGTVIVSHDGEFDGCSTGDCYGGSGCGNYVKVQHGDGTTTLYCHMKKWSVAVSVGQVVRCGDHLGQVGSSGYSTGPHLHFEPRTASNTAIEPFSGPCSGWGSSWISQGGHGGLPGKSCGPPDRDGDGYDESRDCNDGNAGIHPGAAEVCDNGVDEDCAGGDLASGLWYVDADADGYGSAPVRACGGAPPGTSARDGDCDDSRANVSPGAGELCDGLDNDCDGEIDDGPPTEMGPELPALAARITDLSSPSVLAVGTSAPVWVVVENVGARAWRRGELWLQPAARDELSLLFDEGAWPAWDVLAVLESDVPVGGTGVLSGSVRTTAAPGTHIQETFTLMAAGGPPVRCPSGELQVALYARAGAEPTTAAVSVPRPAPPPAAAPPDPDGPQAKAATCAAAGAPYSLGWLGALGLAALSRRRR